MAQIAPNTQWYGIISKYYCPVKYSCVIGFFCSSACFQKSRLRGLSRLTDQLISIGQLALRHFWPSWLVENRTTKQLSHCWRFGAFEGFFYWRLAWLLAFGPNKALAGESGSPIFRGKLVPRQWKEARCRARSLEVFSLGFWTFRFVGLRDSVHKPSILYLSATCRRVRRQEVGRQVPTSCRPPTDQNRRRF